jgi:hypothetical protein
MPKRFIATELWNEDWFLEIPMEYRLFWYYILSKCDHAGLYRANIKTFCSINDVSITAVKALSYFNDGKDRIRVVSDRVWLIEDFYVFQYGTTFNINNKVHESILNAYNQHNIKLTSIRGLIDLKETVKDKDKVKDKDIKGNGGMGEKPKGIKFDENFEKVLLSDDTWQMLGFDQKELAKNGDIKPISIIKGSIY